MADEATQQVRYEVVNYDWSPPDNIVGEYGTEADAKRFAQAMDDCAMRCYVRPKAASATGPAARRTA